MTATVTVAAKYVVSGKRPGALERSIQAVHPLLE